MPPVILMYHSVRKVKRDPFALCVSPKNFERQMQIVASMAKPVPLKRMIEPNIPERAVAVTFDDGYADNLHQALPILERHGIPATIFIATGYIGGNREFWWDEIERLLLGRGSLDGMSSVSAGGHRLSLPNDAGQRRSGWTAWRRRHWKAWDSAGADPRERQFTEIRNWLKQRSVADREEAILQLRRQSTARQQGRSAMTEPELREVAGHQFIEIGAHTVNHPSLGWLDADAQREEITESKRWLETTLNRPIETFAYPYGSKEPAERDYTDQTVGLVRSAGFTLAVTTRNASMSPNDEALELPRRHVHDWDGDTFADKLNAWLDERR